MAAGNERASNRERVIAILAIVASVVVGVSSSVVSCATSRDAQQTAREAQRDAARAERERTDLTELRSVLDRAAADLEKARTAVDDLAFESSVVDPTVPAKVAERRNGRLLAKVLRADRITGSSEVRIMLRLGERSPASIHFAKARTAYTEHAVWVDEGEPSTISSSHAAAERSRERFLDEARKLVGSRLPE